ncbi:uncharacterized protein BDR25DRAFT_221724 [Lindgomyces ingoldianus]|uniref:Uncharacterized protein n=1 Tax=Lindgomyces ingoldianus TaxID=673940 RepID=A0ACB6QYK5_9PLEO|nr:uncharacterized protein BDR25DRAFT_221724 [Lindgomyces ingoldianus]KAF2471945.1 hypothetical protein BDR25DRAFT_221724 [Lindgomyces ingoldianus]
MGKKFFSGWELWQQMTFVLACGIVATIILGLCKLKYDHYRIRKYTKVEKGKKTQTPEMLEAQPQDPKDDIPFGIRAIESGIEVDGVWISRSNTPVGSSASSINEFKLPRSHNSSQLELPQPYHGASSRSSSRAPSSSFDRAVSAERLPDDSRASSPGPMNLSHARGRLPIATSSRYSNPNLLRNSTTLQALEGLDPGSSSGEIYTSPRTSNNSGKSSRRTSDESDCMQAIQEGRPYEAAYINPSTSRHASLPVPVDPRWDLDLLQSHRLSHVAETGQLTPRVRRPGNSGEWASVADNTRLPQDISTTNGVDYFVPRQKTPSPPLPPVAIPPEEVPVVPASSKFTQDGHASNQARQAVPLLETYQPNAYQYHPQTYQPRGPQHEYEEEQPTQYDVKTGQNQRESQVLRKVNSGFEILRPGTFAPPSPEDEKPAGSEKRQSKRLQKKRRPSDGSRTSHFVEQV